MLLDFFLFGLKQFIFYCVIALDNEWTLLGVLLERFEEYPTVVKVMLKISPNMIKLKL